MIRYISSWSPVFLLSLLLACGDDMLAGQSTDAEDAGSSPSDTHTGSDGDDLDASDHRSDLCSGVDCGEVGAGDVPTDVCAGLDSEDDPSPDDTSCSSDDCDGGTEQEAGPDSDEDADDLCSGLDCGPVGCGDFCEEFSVVLLPDTQYYTSKQNDDTNNTYYEQMRWIIANQDAHNIEFVIHLGDITNNNTTAQWTIADAAHTMLDDADVPYSMAPGNHDYLSSGQFSRDDTRYGDYFGPARFADRSWYGGSMAGENLNNYTFFEVGPYRFMIVSLEYAPRKEALCWADELIAAHPEDRVIVATHCYLTHDGAFGTNCPNSTYDVPGADGATVWSELVSRHSNIFLVVSGHVGDSEYVPATGNTGNTVHQMLVDYQFEVPCSAASIDLCDDHCHSSGYTGNGWLRLLTFEPAENRVSANTFSAESGNTSVFPDGVPTLFCSPLNTDGEVHYAQDPLASDHSFSFDYALTSPVAYERDDLGSQTFNDQTVNSLDTGDQLDPQVAPSVAESFLVAWEDDSSSSDGDGNHDILLRSFIPGGCEGLPDRMVHADGVGQQQTPSLATDASGNFVVVWADDADGNGVFQIRARGFWADGSERFAEMTVNSVATGQQYGPDVVMSPDGRFAVVWEDDIESDDDYQVMIRGFEADGTERFADLTVNNETTGQHINPALATDASGRLLVVWQDDSDGNDYYQIRARGFGADGSDWLSAFTVNSVADGQQLNPTGGMDDVGNFAVGWEDDRDRNGVYQVWVRGFTSDGSERFAEVAVSDEGARKPDISMDTDGRFVVVWEDDSDGNGSYQIRACGRTADGSEWFGSRTINRDAHGQQLAPQVALHDTASMVFVWQDDMDGNGYYQILANGLDDLD